MLLEIVQARKTFGEIPALEGVDLRLQPREKLALLGPNGAGKTTLVRAAFDATEPARLRQLRWDHR